MATVYALIKKGDRETIYKHALKLTEFFLKEGAVPNCIPVNKESLQVRCLTENN